MSCICKKNVTYECRSCLKDLLPPIFQCPNGHLICEVCVKKETECPVTECQANLAGLRIRNLEVENVLGILTYHCESRGDGCPTAMNYEEFIGHKLDCSNRAMKFCSLLEIDCNATMKRKFLVDHLVNFHDSACFQSYQLGESLEDHQGASTLNEPLVWVGPAIQYGQKIFVIKTFFNKNSISWMAVLLGSKLEAQKYQVSFKIASPSMISEYQWKGQVSDFKCNFFNSMNYFSIPKDLFQSFITTDMQWKIKFQIDLASAQSSQLFDEISETPTRERSELQIDISPIPRETALGYREIIRETSSSSEEEEILEAC